MKLFVVVMGLLALQASAQEMQQMQCTNQTSCLENYNMLSELTNAILTMRVTRALKMQSIQQAKVSEAIEKFNDDVSLHCEQCQDLAINDATDAWRHAFEDCQTSIDEFISSRPTLSMNTDVRAVTIIQQVVVYEHNLETIRENILKQMSGSTDEWKNVLKLEIQIEQQKLADATGDINEEATSSEMDPAIKELEAEREGIINDMSIEEGNNEEMMQKVCEAFVENANDNCAYYEKLFTVTRSCQVLKKLKERYVEPWVACLNSLAPQPA